MEVNKLYCIDAIELLKGLEDYSADIIFTDPPYALGSEVIIRKDGKPDYKKAVDFMNKWDQPDGAFWETWFKEAFRVLKYGGRVVMFGMDRQLMLNKYYACFAGFIEQQSLYWYFISNFPKASDLSKNLDKNAGVEREVTGVKQGHEEFANRGNKSSVQSLKGTLGGKGGFDRPWMEDPEKIEQYHMSTAPTSDLAKKYDGYKYSIAPLKQTCETIMVFQKPYKTGSCLHDTLAYENGDHQNLCGALDIDGERVEFEDTHNAATNPKYRAENGFKPPAPNKPGNITNFSSSKDGQNISGRYPSQTFVDSEAAEILDRQSGSLTSGAMKKPYTYQNNGACYGKPSGETKAIHESSTGGCSKILHHCDYDTDEFDLFIYCPKVSKSERNAGLDNMEAKVKSIDYRNLTGDPLVDRLHGQGVPTKNNHPTLKPLSLIRHILKLFKTPNPQLLIDSFAGSGTILIIAKELEIDYIGSEKSQEYCTIAEARINPFNSQPTLF